MTLTFSRSITSCPTRAFFVTANDDLITWARTGSLMWMTFGLACCAVEMMQMSMPRYDAERFGFAPRASPRQSDVMIVAGNPDQQGWRRRCARSMTRCGAALCDSRWGRAPMAAAIITIPIRVVRGCDRIVPIDIYVPG